MYCVGAKNMVASIHKDDKVCQRIWIILQILIDLKVAKQDFDTEI
jgi:hypothetical protein